MVIFEVLFESHDIQSLSKIPNNEPSRGETKNLVSEYAVTRKLICAFIFAYADYLFSHGAG